LLSPDFKPGCYACISVSDMGGGISPNVMPRIFEPFFTTKDVGKGTGLGLATVFGIVKQHHGMIDVDNRPGEGVTFHVFLPLSDLKLDAVVQPVVKSKVQRGKETILLVEDELMLRKLTRITLERNGYTVLEVSSGVDALKCWKTDGDRVALLLTDLVMPGGVGGRQLAHELRAERPQLKVIYTSGYSAEIAGRDFQLQTNETFIQKPFESSALLEAIRASLDR
jgi:CheY-like chemotaxis protein